MNGVIAGTEALVIPHSRIHEVTSEVSDFLTTHLRSGRGGVALDSALYIVTVRDRRDQLLAAASVAMSADITALSAVSGAPLPPTHVIDALAVHPAYRRQHLGRNVVDVIESHPHTARQSLLVAISYAMDHCDRFWQAIGYTLTRRAMPAVLPAQVLGLATTPSFTGLSALNTTTPARFVYRTLPIHTEAGPA